MASTGVTRVTKLVGGGDTVAGVFVVGLFLMWPLTFSLFSFSDPYHCENIPCFPVFFSFEPLYFQF